MMISQFEEMEFYLDGGNLPRSHKGRRNEPEMEKSDVQGGADRCYLIPAYIVSIFQFFLIEAAPEVSVDSDQKLSQENFVESKV